jgi:hypothetical protein
MHASVFAREGSRRDPHWFRFERRPPRGLLTLIDKIKAEIKKRAELKAQRMLLKEPKRKPKR